MPLIIFLSFNGFSKKLKITKCLLANGTISYQEGECDNKEVKKNINKTKRKPIAKTKQAHTYTSLSFQQLPTLISASNSTQLISNSVKGYQISMAALNQWNVVNKVYNNKLLHMKFLDNNPHAPMSLMIDFIYPDNKKFSYNELLEIIHLSGSRFIEGSLQGQTNAYKLEVVTGKAVMATYTHSSLIKTYKHLTKGVIFKGQWLIQFTLLSNNLQGSSYQYALEALANTIKIKKIL